jgi:hypothetical protein
MKSYSVTTVLGPFTDFSSVPSGILEKAITRGKDTHRYSIAYALGMLFQEVPDYIKGYFDSFKRWFDKYVEKVYFAEVLLKDEILGFHGHPDLFVRMVDGRDVVPDIKTPAVESPTWKAQLSAYRHLVKVNERLPEYPECMALQPRKDGREAKAILYNYADRDFRAFLSALNAYRYFKG